MASITNGIRKQLDYSLGKLACCSKRVILLLLLLFWLSDNGVCLRPCSTHTLKHTSKDFNFENCLKINWTKKKKFEVRKLENAKMARTHKKQNQKIHFFSSQVQCEEPKPNQWLNKHRSTDCNFNCTWERKSVTFCRKLSILELTFGLITIK